jgi:poly(3-hydroxybutyrate) depolymerase
VAKTNRRRTWLGVVGTLVLLVLVARISLWAAGPTRTLPSPPIPGRFTLAIKSGGYDRVATIHIPKGYKSGTKPPLVLLLHGGGDKAPLMPMNGGEVKTPWGSRQNRPVTEPLAKWAEALGCEKEPKTISEKEGVKKVEYPSKSNGPELTVLYLEGHGHYWPGARPSLPESMIGPITSKLNATDTIWEFFKSVPSTKK